MIDKENYIQNGSNLKTTDSQNGRNQNLIDILAAFPQAHFVLAKHKDAFEDEWQNRPVNERKLRAHTDTVGLIAKSLNLVCLDFDCDDALNRCASILQQLDKAKINYRVFNSRTKGRLHAYLHVEDNSDITVNDFVCAKNPTDHIEVRYGSGGKGVYTILWDKDNFTVNVIKHLHDTCIDLAEVEHFIEDAGFTYRGGDKDNDTKTPKLSRKKLSITAYCDILRKATDEGIRNNTLRDVVRELSIYYDREDFEDEIKAIARSLGLTDREINATFKSAYSYGLKRRKKDKKERFWTYARFENLLNELHIDFRFDVLSDCVQYRAGANAWKRLTDLEESQLYVRVQEHANMKLDSQTWRLYTMNRAGANKVNSFVSDYLSKLPLWDCEKRLDSFFANTFDLHNTKILAQTGEMLFAAMVSRALNKLTETPTRFELMIVLVGEMEGEGKSSFWRSLLPKDFQNDHFSDSFDLSSSLSEMREQMEGIILLESSELIGGRRAEIERFKTIITTPSLPKVRKKFERRVKAGYRTDVLVGSTNDKKFIPLTTGRARRWIPIEIESVNPKNVIEFVEQNRTQLWAEALTRLDEIQLYFDKEMEVEQAQKNKQFMSVSTDLETLVVSLADEHLQPFLMVELLEKIYDEYKSLSRQNTRKFEMEVAIVLRANGYSKKQITIEGKKGTYWARW